ICPTGMHSLWKFAAFRLPASIQILAGRRALRCFQNELHHGRILNEKWYQSSTSTLVRFASRLVMSSLRSSEQLREKIGLDSLSEAGLASIFDKKPLK
ncbi:MAG: hypothetical protein O7C75_12285, partial [Verrucomicrobia bacterium]|nr:hypothetical protein [Verrucomicrobiota bacterium]